MFRDFLGSVVQSEILGCEGSTRNHGNSRIMGTSVFFLGINEIPGSISTHSHTIT